MKNETKSCCCSTAKPWMKNLGLLILRLTVGAVFIYAGWMKLSDMTMVVGMFTNMGLPIPAVFAYLIAVGEFAGGIGIVLGIFTRIAALGMAIIMVGALLLVHVGMGQWDAGTQLVVVLLGANLALAGLGGGSWKLWCKKCPCS